MKFAALLAAAMMLTACATNAQAQQAPLATPTLAGTPRPPSATPTATWDVGLQATATANALAGTAVALQLQQQDVERGELAIAVQRQGIQLTAQAGQLLASQATSTAVFGQAAATSAAQITATSAAQAADAADLLNSAKVSALGVGTMAGVLLAVVLTWFGVAAIREWVATQRMVRAAYSEPTAPVIVSPVPADSEPENRWPGGVSLQLFTASGITVDQLRRLAAGVAAGVPITHDNWTPADKGFAEGRFVTLQHLLVAHDLAAWNDSTHKSGITLTERGRRFFSEMAD